MSGEIRWYIQKNGKASGPFSFNDLKDQIKQGLLLGHDLIFKEGTNEWKRAFDWAEVAEAISNEQKTSFTSLFTVPSSGSADQWVLLIRHQEGKSLRFEQDGPFETEKIRELLKAGRLKPTDHIWKKGLSQWVQVSSRTEFSAPLWNVKDESVPLLQSVVETPPISAAVPESKPVEAIVKPAQPAAKPIESVVKPQRAALPKTAAKIEFPEGPKEEFEIKTSAPSQTPIPGPAQAAVAPAKPRRFEKAAAQEAPEESESSSSYTASQKRSVGFPLKGKEWVLASLAILGIVAVVPMVRKSLFPTGDLVLQQAPAPTPQEIATGESEQASSNPEVSPDKPMLEPAPPTMDLPPSEAPAAAAVPVPPPSPQAIAVAKLATQVKKPEAKPEVKPEPAKPVVAKAPVKAVVPDKNISWAFAVPAEPGSSLFVVISGISGQILDVPALTLKLSLFMPDSRKLQLEPRSLRLPEGQYQIHVQQNGKTLLKGEREYVIDTDKFEKKLAQHRKQIVFEQQQEKRALLKALDSLQRFLTTNSKDVLNRPKSQSARAVLRKKFDTLARSEVKKLRQQRHSLMYTAGWTAFAAQYEVIQDLLDGGGPRNPAGRPDVEALKKKISQTRAQVSQTSLWSKD